MTLNSSSSVASAAAAFLFITAAEPRSVGFVSGWLADPADPAGGGKEGGFGYGSATEDDFTAIGTLPDPAVLLKAPFVKIFGLASMVWTLGNPDEADAA